MQSGLTPLIPGIVVFILLSAGAVSGAPAFNAEQRSDRVVVACDSKAIAHYVFKDDSILRPYFAHVKTLDGIQVTRRHPPVADADSGDHATMHPGLWLGFGDVAGTDFWRNKGIIRHDRFTRAPIEKDGALTFATASSMLASNGSRMAQLELQFAFSLLSGGYLLTWHAAVTPSIDGFYFGDQEEMGFGVRVATGLTEKDGGKILTSEGARGAKASWGRIAAWSDYSGTLNGRAIGIALFAAPENFRPSWFHNRDYGLMVANPFGRQAFTRGEPSRVEVLKGSSFTIRAGFFIHSTPLGQESEIAVTFQQFSRSK